MNDHYLILSSLALDLKRSALAFYHGSDIVGKRFLQESLRRRSEVDYKKVDPYIAKVLDKIDTHDADDLLMYSVIVQNYTLRLKA